MRYKVAGHVFQIDGTDLYAAVAEKIDIPYRPFAVSDDEREGNPLFVMELQKEALLWQESVPVFTNRDNVEPGFIALSVFKDDEGYHFEFTQSSSSKVNGRLSVSPDFSKARMSLSGTDIEQWLTFTTGVNFCYMLSTAVHQTVLTHSSCVVYKGKAYIFLGKSGTGKSTHSRMWLKALEGVELMNDDHPVIRIDDAGMAIAYGSPWSGKTHCYKNMHAPLGGIVRISRAPYNKASRLAPIQAYGSLLTSCSGMSWEKELADGRDSTIQGIIRNVPSWVMECLPDEDAAHVCSKSVTEGF
jgi:hypothetical protein